MVIKVNKSKPIQTINNIKFVFQEPQLGTGHAIQILCDHVKEKEGKLLVLNGDVPLIKSETLRKLVNFHENKNADVSLLTTKKNPYGYGRVFVKENFIEKIVEEKIVLFSKDAIYW